MTIRFKTTARDLLAGFMALWLSGVVFLLVCGAQTDEAEFCPLMKRGAHCEFAERAKNAEKITNRTESDGIDCCAFIPIVFDKNRINDCHQQKTFTTRSTVAKQPKPIFVRTNFNRLHLYASASLPRNDTFLRNRTFRV